MRYLRCACSDSRSRCIAVGLGGGAGEDGVCSPCAVSSCLRGDGGELTSAVVGVVGRVVVGASLYVSPSSVVGASSASGGVSVVYVVSCAGSPGWVSSGRWEAAEVATTCFSKRMLCVELTSLLVGGAAGGDVGVCEALSSFAVGVVSPFGGVALGECAFCCQFFRNASNRC